MTKTELGITLGIVATILSLIILTFMLVTLPILGPGGFFLFLVAAAIPPIVAAVIVDNYNPNVNYVGGGGRSNTTYVSTPSHLNTIFYQDPSPSTTYVVGGNNMRQHPQTPIFTQPSPSAPPVLVSNYGQSTNLPMHGGPAPVAPTVPAYRPPVSPQYGSGMPMNPFGQSSSSPSSALSHPMAGGAQKRQMRNGDIGSGNSYNATQVDKGFFTSTTTHSRVAPAVRTNENR